LHPETVVSRHLASELISSTLILAGVMLLAFGSMWTGVDAELLKTVLTIIFGPLVALVSAATGFYYGSRSSSS